MCWLTTGPTQGPVSLCGQSRLAAVHCSALGFQHLLFRLAFSSSQNWILLVVSQTDVSGAQEACWGCFSGRKTCPLTLASAFIGSSGETSLVRMP